MPDRNVERLLRNSNVPVPADDQRRLDLIVPGLNISRGVPLFCDATVLSVISLKGASSSGVSFKWVSASHSNKRNIGLRPTISARPILRISHFVPAVAYPIKSYSYFHLP